MKKLLLLPLTAFLVVTLVLGQGSPGFELVPEDRSMTSAESITLEWVLRNADGSAYYIGVAVADGPFEDAAKGVVQNDLVSYKVISPPVGNLTINLLVEVTGATLNDTVTISVTEDLGVDSTVETSIDTGNFPIHAFLVSTFAIFVLRKKVLS